MIDSYLTFHTFSDEETAADFVDKIGAAEIDYKLEKVSQILDSNIIGSSAGPSISLKIKASDFEKAHQVLNEYYKTLLNDINKDYYLFSFTNAELFEILTKPDEWGYLDYQLAQKILSDRGEKINPVLLGELKKERISELAKPEKSSKSLIFLGYCFFLFAGIPTILIGRSIINDKKILPDGQSVFSFSEVDRKHGRRMIKIGIFWLCIVIFLGGLLFIRFLIE